MARAIWTGAINFGLVTIPVKLMTAIRDKSIHFNLLHDKDKGRVHYQRVCDHCGKKLEWNDVVKGYPVSKDKYVVLSDEDLKKANPEATQSVDIVAFAKLEEIDPIYFDTPYYLEPEKRGRHAYALLREALAKSGRVGIARVVIRTKEHLAALKPDGDALVLELMHWADEVVPAKGLELPSAKDSKNAPGGPEMKAALMLIDGMTQTFDANSFHDQYRKEVLEIVDERAEGKALPKAPAANKAKTTNVVDLAEVLRQSLASHKGKIGNDTAPAHKTSRSKTKAHKTAAKPTRKAVSRRKSA